MFGASEIEGGVLVLIGAATLGAAFRQPSERGTFLLIMLSAAVFIAALFTFIGWH